MIRISTESLRYTRGHSGSYCIIWIETSDDLIVPDTKDFYLYYGNASASSVSHFDNTFDELRDNAEYESDPENRWTLDPSNPNVTLSYDTAVKHEGSKSLKIECTTYSQDRDLFQQSETPAKTGTVRLWIKVPKKTLGDYLFFKILEETTGTVIVHIKWRQGNLYYEDSGGWNLIEAVYDDQWDGFELRFDESTDTVDIYRMKSGTWTLIQGSAERNTWSNEIDKVVFTIDVGYNKTWYLDEFFLRKENTNMLTWGAEQTEPVDKELEILYHTFTDTTLEILCHALSDTILEILYHSMVDQSLEIQYHVYSGVNLEILYNVLADKSLTIRYHAWEYIDFLLEINVQSSISADCDTAAVIIPNDQLVSISNYDVGNGEWILEKTINGIWTRQFCGRCKETFLRAPPPRIEFKLYDYTIFLTQFYYTGIHSQIEASRILRGYGTQTQILNLDLDAINWSGNAEVSDEDTIKQEGIGSLKVLCIAEGQWISRLINDDWSSYGRVTFWMQSSNPLMDFALKITDGGGNWRRYILKTLDLSNEWKEYYVDLPRPSQSYGDMNWSSISHITFESLATGTHYLDDIRLEEGVQDENGNFANGILYDMHINPAGIEYTGVKLTIEWTQVKRIDCARNVKDEVSTAKDQPWEFYVDEWKIAHFSKRKEQTEAVAEINEENLVSCDIKISWW